MYNMAQRPPADIQRDLSGDLRKADEGTRTPDLLITSERGASHNYLLIWTLWTIEEHTNTDIVLLANDLAALSESFPSRSSAKSCLLTAVQYATASLLGVMVSTVSKRGNKSS